MDKFLEKHHLPKLNKEETESLIRLIKTAKLMQWNPTFWDSMDGIGDYYAE